MCYQNCIYERNDGSCTRSNFPENWICPPDQAVCVRCGQVFDFDGLEDQLCDSCRAEEEKQMEKNKRTCYVCHRFFDKNDSEREDFCQDCLEKIDADKIVWRDEFEQYLSDEDYQKLRDKEVKEAEDRNKNK